MREKVVYNTQKSIRKAPLKIPTLKMTLRGFAVYFCVDRCRRKVCYWGQSISRFLSLWLFLKLIFCLQNILFSLLKRFWCF